MKYNTLPLKNITNDIFAGKYNGVEFNFKPAEIRFLPTHVSQHLVKQMYSITANKNKGREMIEENEFRQKALMEEINTAESEKTLTFAEEIAEHEKAYKEMVRNKELEKIIAGEDV